MAFINNDIKNIIQDILINNDIDYDDLIFYDIRKNVIDITSNILFNIYDNNINDYEKLISEDIDKLIND